SLTRGIGELLRLLDPGLSDLVRTPQETTQAELIAFCREQMAHFKAPKRIIFTPLPKTSTGKVQKFVLRNQLG
ncbi:AMP-binding enzyme, partial [Aeromonas veronii]|uniref:AMP-binding enzyme n=1 Tax=Aeromonas veronii TaxID=654 RepID=UPI003BA1A231